MNIVARLKDNLRIGAGLPFYREMKDVVIVDKEEHPIWGMRYKIFGCDEWFEENAFEFIDGIK